MTAHVVPDPGYNGLTRTEPTLPSKAYYDRDHHERELRAIWYRNWIYLCRADAIDGPLAYRTFAIGNQNIVVLRDEDGGLRAYHNTCRHRGSELCQNARGRLKTRLIVCPYHNWAYALDGTLKRTPTLARPEGFDPADYPLYDVAIAEWRGFVFINLAGKDAAAFDRAIDRGSDRLDNWPLEDLVPGHVYETEIACNWKIFWDNFNECVHCPGIHPELSDLVPIYGRSIMSERDDPHWRRHGDSDDPALKGGLREGAETWSMDGRATGPQFPGLTEAERAAGQSYMMALPSMFIAAHVDYVRVVTLRPLGPETMSLRAEWLFARETLDAPDFNLANAVDFAILVMDQDARACELNQRGLRSMRHEAGVLMAEEYYLHEFQRWVSEQLESKA